jgi:hypothetical protein
MISSFLTSFIEAFGAPTVIVAALAAIVLIGLFETFRQEIKLRIERRRRCRSKKSP